MSTMQAKATRDPKSAAIIDAAFQTFFQYGVKRATMDDIARAAGMSRPALYLVYKNKNDIFRACILSMTDDLRAKLAAVTGASGAAEDRILAIIRTGIVEPHEFIGASPNAEELFALKSDVAADLFRGWMRLIEEAIEAVLLQEAEAGRLDLARSGTDAASIAAMVTDAAEGFKLRPTSTQVLAERLETFVRMLIGPLTGARR